VLRHRLAQCLSERLERGGPLSHRHKRRVAQVITLVQETLHSLAHSLRPTSNCFREQSTAVNMGPDAVSQILTTPRAEARRPSTLTSSTLSVLARRFAMPKLSWDVVSVP
jgi:hypothetical protein